MPPNTDPYTTKLHKLVDAFLIIVTILLIALVLRGSGHGEPLVSVAPPSFWSNLRVFQLQPKISVVPPAYDTVTLAEAEFIAASRADLFDLTTIADDSKGGITPIMVVPERPQTSGTLSDLEPAYSYHMAASSRQNLADNSSQVPGIGSAIPAFRIGFVDAAISSTVTTFSSGQIQLLSEDNVRRGPLHDDSSASARVVETSRESGLIAGPGHNSPVTIISGIAVSSIALVSESSKAESVQQLAPKAVTVGPDSITADQTWDGGAGGLGTAWLTATNWVGDTAFPGSQSVTTNTDVATFAAAGTGSPIGINMNFTGNTFYLGGIDITGNLNRLIGDSSATAGTLQLNGTTINAINNVILRNAGTGTLTLQASQSGTMTVALGNSTENVINIDGAGGITISSVIKNGVANANLTLGGSGSGILTFSGTAANSYSGTTTINAGELDLFKTTGVNAIAGAIAVNGGTLKLLANNQIIDSGSVSVSGGTLNIGTFSDTVAGATLTSGNISGTGGTLTGSSYDVRSGSISARLGGNGSTLTKTTVGTVTLSGDNTYTGLTNVTAGTLAESSTGFISNSSDLTVNGNTAVFDIGNNHIDFFNTVTLDGGGTLTGTGTSSLNALSSLELKSGNVNVTLSGNNGLVMNKTTAGTVILNASGGWTGLTSILAGTLVEGANGFIHDTSSLLINNAIFDLGANHSDLVGTVALQNGGSITGSGTSTLTANTGGHSNCKTVR